MTRALKTYQTVGTQVEGGDSFNSVLLLQAEQYQDTVKVEETLYSAVALQEGQRLSINATIVGQPDLSTGEALSLSRQLQVYDPARQQMRIDTGSGEKKLQR